MDIQDLVSVEEAAKILGYRNSSVALLCRQGKLKGAFRKGHQWLIPRTTIENYTKAPQGFAAIWKRKREAEQIELGNDESFGEDIELNRELLKYIKRLIKKIDNLERKLDMLE